MLPILKILNNFQKVDPLLKFLKCWPLLQLVAQQDDHVMIIYPDNRETGYSNVQLLLQEEEAMTNNY